MRAKKLEEEVKGKLLVLSDVDLISRLEKSWRKLCDVEPTNYLVSFALYKQNRFTLSDDINHVNAFLTRYWHVSPRIAVERYAVDVIVALKKAE